jgi:hypothetical protein
MEEVEAIIFKKICFHNLADSCNSNIFSNKMSDDAADDLTPYFFWDINIRKKESFFVQ